MTGSQGGSQGGGAGKVGLCGHVLEGMGLS